jgi:argininosuccinate lyase
LWLKRALLDVDADATELVQALLEFARRHARVSFPGYTHTRKAMPSSMGLWAAGHAAGLIDTLEALPTLWASLDLCPLGSAAGYGVPLSLDRAAAARALGFATVAAPVTTVQNGRGKLEAAALFWCAQLGHDAGKAASDVVLFSAEEYGYLILDDSLATGSSLMPHKRNPDLFELTRARAAAVEGDLATVLALRGKLASGYHRDFQMLKEPLLRGVRRAGEMLEMLRIGIEGVQPDRERCAAALAGGVLATGSALAMAARGVPFREAYRTVSDSLAKGTGGGTMQGARPRSASLQDLGLRNLRKRIIATSRFARREERHFAEAMERLAGRGTLPEGSKPWRRGASA